MNLYIITGIAAVLFIVSFLFFRNRKNTAEQKDIPTEPLNPTFRITEKVIVIHTGEALTERLEKERA